MNEQDLMGMSWKSGKEGAVRAPLKTRDDLLLRQSQLKGALKSLKSGAFLTSDGSAKLDAAQAELKEINARLAKMPASKSAQAGTFGAGAGAGQPDRPARTPSEAIRRSSSIPSTVSGSSKSTLMTTPVTPKEVRMTPLERRKKALEDSLGDYANMIAAKVPAEYQDQVDELNAIRRKLAGTTPSGTGVWSNEEKRRQQAEREFQEREARAREDTKRQADPDAYAQFLASNEGKEPTTEAKARALLSRKSDPVKKALTNSLPLVVIDRFVNAFPHMSMDALAALGGASGGDIDTYQRLGKAANKSEIYQDTKQFIPFIGQLSTVVDQTKAVASALAAKTPQEAAGTLAKAFGPSLAKNLMEHHFDDLSDAFKDKNAKRFGDAVKDSRLPDNVKKMIQRFLDKKGSPAPATTDQSSSHLLFGGS